MNVLMLTAGTGSFHCGTCLRDNTLAHGLRGLGHQVTLVPLYLPLVTDGANASEGQPVQLGGVSAYLQQHSALYRGLPAWVDRVLDRPAVLSLAARRAGATDPSSLGPMTLSMLRGPEGHQARAIASLVDALVSMEPRAQVVLLSNALLLGLAAPIRAALQVPVVCTLQGEDVFLDALPQEERTEAWSLVAERAMDVEGLVAVSASHGAEMTRRLGLDEGAVAVALNGIDLTGYTPAETPPDTPTIGFLARLCDDKGLGALIDGYVALRKRWEGPPPALHLGGALTASDRPALSAACKRLEQAGVSDTLQVRPNMSVEEKQAFLRGLSVLCVPTQIGESFGLYAIEAMAAGVPVIAPARGALPEVIAETGGGVLVVDDTPEGLADALIGLLDDPAQRSALGQAGRAAVVKRFGAERMAKDVAEILQKVTA